MKIETFLQLILLLPTAFQFHIKLSVNTGLLLDQTTEQNRNKNNLTEEIFHFFPLKCDIVNSLGNFPFRLKNKYLVFFLIACSRGHLPSHFNPFYYHQTIVCQAWPYLSSLWNIYWSWPHQGAFALSRVTIRAWQHSLYKYDIWHKTFCGEDCKCRPYHYL